MNGLGSVVVVKWWKLGYILEVELKLVISILDVENEEKKLIKNDN